MAYHAPRPSQSLQDEPEDEDIEAARAAVTAADEAYQRAPRRADRRRARACTKRSCARPKPRVKQAQAAYDQVSWNPLIAAFARKYAT